MSSPIADEPETPRPRVPAARYLSWAAVAAFVVLVLGFIIQAGLFSENLPQAGNAPEGASVKTPAQISVASSRYTGSDKDKQPYWVEAASALQDDKNPDLVHLQAVKGEMRRVSGEVIHVDAKNALYDNEAKQLDLEGDVRIISQGSYEARMQKARVVMADKTLTSEVPVTVTFETGRIDANGMKITDDGKRILFFNRVKAHFEGAAEGSATP